MVINQRNFRVCVSCLHKSDIFPSDSDVAYIEITVQLCVGQRDVQFVRKSSLMNLNVLDLCIMCFRVT